MSFNCKIPVIFNCGKPVFKGQDYFLMHTYSEVYVAGVAKLAF